MKNRIKSFLIINGIGLFFLLVALSANAQITNPDPSTPSVSSHLNTKNELKYMLNEDGTHYIKFTFLNQTWVRFSENNPGTTVNGKVEATMFDIGLRRTRFQLFGQLTDRVFFYAQFGQNNFNFLSQRKLGAFFHDVVSEYAVVSNYLSMGAGLTGWTGISRFSSPSVGTILGVDAPLFEQATNDMNDLFLRKLSIYAKGKIGKLDYRLALSKPFIVNSGVNINLTGMGGTAPMLANLQPDYSTYSVRAPQPQVQGYFMYQFLDQETNQIPYTTGTYLGKKRVFNVGAGFSYQKNAMWHKTVDGDTVNTNLLIWSVDLFYDTPLNKEKGTALSIYAAFFKSDFGPNYVRNLGVMSLGDGVKAGMDSFNGTGTAFPIVGTGTIGYLQVGYLLPKSWLKEAGQLQPYAAVQYGKYTLLKDAMLWGDVGVNWLIKDHNAKITLAYQNRPIYSKSDLTAESRKGLVVLQYQIFF